MRTPQDALRSLHKYVALVLDPDWEVRLWDEEGTFKRPFARVSKIGPTLPTPASALVVDVTQAMAVYLQPQEQQTVEASILVAEKVEDAIYQGFLVGVGPGAPLRVPMWDWTGIPLDGPGSDATARYEHDYMRIVRPSLSVNRLHDPTDDRLITVVVEMRVTWRRPGRVTKPGTPVQSVLTDLKPVG